MEPDIVAKILPSEDIKKRKTTHKFMNTNILQKKHSLKQILYIEYIYLCDRLTTLHYFFPTPILLTTQENFMEYIGSWEITDQFWLADINLSKMCPLYYPQYSQLHLAFFKLEDGGRSSTQYFIKTVITWSCILEIFPLKLSEGGFEPTHYFLIIFRWRNI